MLIIDKSIYQWIVCHSLLLAGHFLYDQYQPCAGEGGVAKFWKKHNFSRTLQYFHGISIDIKWSIDVYF